MPSRRLITLVYAAMTLAVILKWVAVLVKVDYDRFYNRHPEGISRKRIHANHREAAITSLVISVTTAVMLFLSST